MTKVISRITTLGKYSRRKSAPGLHRLDPHLSGRVGCASIPKCLNAGLDYLPQTTDLVAHDNSYHVLPEWARLLYTRRGT
jgi:hypothetical protein